MCNCVKELESKIKERFVSESKEKIHEFVDESENGLQCKGLMFSTGKWEIVLPIEYKFRVLKKDGIPENRVRKYRTSVIPSYCPICGEKKSA